MQFFLDQFGLTALPVLLNLSLHDLHELMSLMRNVSQKKVASHHLNSAYADVPHNENPGAEPLLIGTRKNQIEIGLAR